MDQHGEMEIYARGRKQKGFSSVAGGVCPALKYALNMRRREELGERQGIQI